MRRALAASLLVLSLAACGDDSSKTGEKTAEAMKPEATSEAPMAEKAAPAPEASDRTPSPAGAKVMILEPTNGATVKSPVTIKFGVEGMEVAPAGTDTPNTGHHHLYIDAKLDDPSAPVPADANHIHYGKGQTEVQVDLAPGTHTLQDVFADKNHIPHDPPVVSDVVSITVE
jgi:Domain of unknown function (DUF4399)